MKTCLGCFNLDYNKSGSAKNCHDDTIWYLYYLIMGIEFHVFIHIIHVVIQTSASDWVPESDVCKRVRDLTLAVTDTFLANLTRSNVWQCWQASRVWNRDVRFNQWAVSFPSNQPIRVWLSDTFPTGNTWGLVSWRWCIVIIFDNLNIMNTLFPAPANTHKHLLSLPDQ